MILKVADLKAVVAIGSRLEKEQPVPAALQICDRRGEFGEAQTDYAALWRVAESSLAAASVARPGAIGQYNVGRRLLAAGAVDGLVRAQARTAMRY